MKPKHWKLGPDGKYHRTAAGRAVQRQTAKELRDGRRARGCCPACGEEGTGGVQCSPCREYRRPYVRKAGRKYAARARKLREAKKKCLYCGKRKPQAGRRHCPSCLKRRRADRLTAQAEALNRGDCSTCCSRPAKIGKDGERTKTCEVCAEARRGRGDRPAVSLAA